MAHRPPRIGLALGSGSARGWAHLGVLRMLERHGITPDVVCGTSIGAFVGAAYAAGELERLESWVGELTWQGVVGLMDFRMSGGLIQGAKLVEFFRSHFRELEIHELRKPFACVATELTSGREVWLREGPVVDAVRASIAIPGLLTPVVREDHLLVDGGVVNPVPVSLCRALGAEIVIAVDLNWDLTGRRKQLEGEAKAVSGPADTGLFSSVLGRFRSGKPKEPVVQAPSMTDVLATSLNIMQVRITQSRLAGEPADVLIRPRLSHIAALDFHRGAIAATEGERATELVLPMLREVIGD